ncbi:MAG: DUF1501 domain-containing protein, partial [Fuerstiella sp.]|nr:DUF1501 domain-containing protein [Fuerstiella sp.]
GMEVRNDPMTIQNLMATVCRALNLDHESTNMSNIGRPIPLADHGAVPARSLLS